MRALCHVFFRDLRNLLWTKTTVFKERKEALSSQENLGIILKRFLYLL